MSRLKLVTTTETEAPLRRQVNEILTDHKQEVIDTVRKWIIYWTHQGAWQLDLSDCPTVSPRDRDYVVDWLRQEGFSVYKPRAWGRVIINLRPDAHPGDPRGGQGSF